MLQPQTGTSKELGSIDIVNIISSFFHPTCFKRFLDLCYPTPDLLLPPPHPSPSNTALLYQLHPLLPT